ASVTSTDASKLHRRAKSEIVPLIGRADGRSGRSRSVGPESDKTYDFSGCLWLCQNRSIDGTSEETIEITGYRTQSPHIPVHRATATNPLLVGGADPRTTLTHIRSRDRLSMSPAYVVNH
ncbi:MAG: hypothetical protein EXS05_22765, partial [Planctomycetaceae bacterium]|nr:hypothetical protein [Planctomycetaceae bacterium]